jgi:hypothetical protein
MPFKPNYRFERIERERKKQAKKEEKLKRRNENSTPSEADGVTENGEQSSHPDS